MAPIHFSDVIQDKPKQNKTTKKTEELGASTLNLSGYVLFKNKQANKQMHKTLLWVDTAFLCTWLDSGKNKACFPVGMDKVGRQNDLLKRSGGSWLSST